jgi:hypothetical protein
LHVATQFVRTEPGLFLKHFFSSTCTVWYDSGEGSVVSVTVQVIDVRARSEATPGEVFGVLADLSCWPRWGIWAQTAIERPGEGSPAGRGAIRVLTSRSFGRTVVSRELVTELVPGSLMAYELLSGLPLRNYRARVELTADGGGTAIRWIARFDRATPGLTWLYGRFFRHFLTETAQRLARYAEERRAVGA